MNIRHLTTDDTDAWSDCYERAGKPGPYHCPDYLQRLAGSFEHADERAEAFVLEDGDDIVYYPYIRRSLQSVPFADETEIDLSKYDDIVSSWYYGGPFTSQTDSDLCTTFAKEFSEYCRSEQIVAEFVRFDPNRRNHEQFDCLEPTFNRETIRLDLTKKTETIWEEFEKRNRNAIRQAQQTDIEVYPTTDRKEYKAFYEIYSNAMDAKDATEHYRFEFDFFVDLLATDLSTLLVATYDGDVIGGAIVVHEDDLAHDYLRASDPDYWDMRVNNLLCYEALIHMRETGRKTFDFQGGRPGVFKFKKSFSSDRGELYIGKSVHIPDRYDELLTEADSFGIDTDSGYFPEYRIEKSN
jgi:lipid II:glycine glycyltransferase (peptidoglycan interpeptide bridge formation enzyme)